MKSQRLEQLSDGIFAIVMTILVFELKIPAIASLASNEELKMALVNMSPIFLSYILAFSTLFTYWRAHHFFISVYAKNVDLTLTNINALFFMLVSLIPFSASLLGSKSDLELPIILFSINVIFIGLMLFIMRNYVFRSPHIKNIEVSNAEITRGTIRMMVPVVFAIIAIPLCFFSKIGALTLLTVAILFNFSRFTTHLFSKFIN